MAEKERLLLIAFWAIKTITSCSVFRAEVGLELISGSDGVLRTVVIAAQSLELESSHLPHPPLSVAEA